MGVASLVLGIISLVVAFVPVVGLIALVPAIIGLVLGIVDLVHKKKAEEKYSKALAGTICSAIAIALIIIYALLFGVFVYNIADKVDQNSVQEFINTIQESDGDFNFSFSLNNIEINENE